MNKNISKTDRKISINDDILCHLFKYVNLKEQLNLTRVCTQFHDIIVRYIWKRKYKDVNVIITPPNNYIITNIINQEPTALELVQDCRTLFNEKELEEFLNKNDKNIQRFFVCWQEQFEETYFEFPIKLKLTNLLEVHFCRLKICEEHLKDLNINCPKLENLSLDQCYNRYYFALVIGMDVDIATIGKLQNLKCLEMNDLIFCNGYEEILTKLKLQQIKLNVKNEFESHDLDNASKQRSYPCEQLTLSGLTQKSFNKLNVNLLNDLKNLTKLTINGCGGTNISLNNKFFKTLSESCYKLTYLKLQRFEIVNFLPLYTLTELILEDGFGLTWQDLKQILAEMKLKRFSSSYIMYSGTFQCFKLAPNFEYFDYTGHGEEFIQLFEMNKDNFENLTTLIWHQNYLDTKVSNVAKYCGKLQSLDINYYDLLTSDLSYWPTLQKLQISTLAEFILTTSDILKILKHSSLTHLTIFCPSVDLDVKDRIVLKDMDYETNLLYLDIPLRVFKIYQHFWLDLVSKNSKLNLLIVAEYTGALVDYAFLSDLIKNPKFPKRLKSIKIYGFNIGKYV